MNRSDRELDGLFLEYRDAVEVPEAGVNFMPMLWERIEARRRVVFQWKKVTRIFVGSSAFVCLLMVGLWSRLESGPVAHYANYVDVLAASQPAENLAAQGIWPSNPESLK